MKITHRLSIAFTSLSFGAALSAAPLLAQAAHTLVPADKVQWGPAPPALPAGAQIAVLEGNPSEKGPVTLRLRFPANYNIPPHWHSMAERVTVLSGALNVGMGDKLDRQGSQALEPGGFVSLPANMHHFAWTAVPTIVQISLEGPFDIFYVNPADNPQTKTSTTRR
jgi:quercetin dioxygenase-like cupin family protein